MKQDALNLVGQITNAQYDPVSAGNFYDEAVYSIDDGLWMTDFVLIQATSHMHEFTLPTTTISLRGVVYDTRWLTEATLRGVEQLQRDWRDIGGREPFVYVLQDDPKLDVEVHPNTPVAGAAVTAQVFGATYPQRNFVAFITEFRSTIPKWLEPAIAFATTAREYQRNSDHMDPDGAACAAKLSNILLACVA